MPVDVHVTSPQVIPMGLLPFTPSLILHSCVSLKLAMMSDGDILYLPFVGFEAVLAFAFVLPLVRPSAFGIVEATLLFPGALETPMLAAFALRPAAPLLRPAAAAALIPLLVRPEDAPDVPAFLLPDAFAAAAPLTAAEALRGPALLRPFPLAALLLRTEALGAAAHRRVHASVKALGSLACNAFDIFLQSDIVTSMESVDNWPKLHPGVPQSVPGICNLKRPTSRRSSCSVISTGA